ncbi:hypothetical protein [Spiroplasma endosymbiont of Labia minor]|uniref:hypothetical protein n=1 Tax=Spiroplasma endosymbiont of Labia minor TaxID=3066305 RepID=UPI0030D538D7
MKIKNWFLLIFSLFILLLSVIVLFFINVENNLSGVIIHINLENQDVLSFKFLEKKDIHSINFIKQIVTKYNDKTYIFSNEFEIYDETIVIRKFNHELEDATMLSALANVGEENILQYLLKVVF